MKKLFFLLLIPFFLGCENDEEIAQTLQSQELRGLWVHSHEEGRDELTVWRPETFNFPPSRGREQMEFMDEGQLRYYMIAPTDGLLPVDGHWSLEDGNVLKLNFSGGERESMQGRILRLEKERLEIEWER